MNTRTDELGFEISFTEGDWRVEKTESDIEYAYLDIATDDNTICTVYHDPKCFMDEESILTAALIAAAPSLYHALAKLVALHSAEQEGLSSGRPTSEQWIKAVEEAGQVLLKARTLK